MSQILNALSILAPILAVFLSSARPAVAGPNVRQFLAANNFCAGGVKIQAGSAAITQANNLNL